MTASWTRTGLALLLAAGLLGTGCAAGNAYRQGQKEARHGNWDLAVARLTRALEKSPGNIKFKIGLENARIQAGRFHHKEARKHLAADELERAAEELEIASRYDPANESAAGDLRVVRERIRKREEEKEQRAQLESMKSRAQAARVPLPVLSPRSAVPITLRFTETSLEKVFETLSKVSGVNILFDEGFRDKRDTVNLTGVTFQDALELITFKNRLFYKVVDQNTIIIVPESPAKRRSYDELLVRTFYLENAEANDTLTLVKNITGITKSASNVPLNAITLMGTVDQLALAARVIASNDKARGEVLVEVEILEINRTRAKEYGIELANYTAAVAFSPTGGSGEVAGGLTSLRAHLLSSFNLADFVVSIPSGLFTSFLQSDNNARVLAAPRLRAAEGKKTSLRMGREVPIPVTTFTAAAAGPSTFAPATSFQYRNVGVNLEMTPKVAATGEITLEVSAEFSIIGANVNVGSGDNPINVPTFSTRNVNGLLRMREGQTVLIGGLVQGSEQDDLKGVLGLQSIPVLNKVFTSRQRKKDESEVIISLTPHLVRAPKLTEEDFASTFAGTLERVSVPSARPPLFGVEEPTPAPTPAAPASPEPESTPTRPAAPAPAPVTVPPGNAPAEPAAAPGAAPSPAPGVASGGRPATALLSPAEASLKAGEAASLSVVVLNASGLLGVEVVLSFDPALLEATDAVPGPLLTLDGSPVNTERNIEPGRVRVRLMRGAATAGSGAVATLTFKGLQSGTAVVAVQSVTLVTEAGATQPMLPGPARISVQP